MHIKNLINIFNILFTPLLGTDKVSHHRYDKFYPYFVEGLRDKPINMLEIGLFHGSSFKMWKQYFPKGKKLHNFISIPRILVLNHY